LYDVLVLVYLESSALINETQEVVNGTTDQSEEEKRKEGKERKMK